jgi:hypothetical protein
MQSEVKPTLHQEEKEQVEGRERERGKKQQERDQRSCTHSVEESLLRRRMHQLDAKPTSKREKSTERKVEIKVKPNAFSQQNLQRNLRSV